MTEQATLPGGEIGAAQRGDKLFSAAECFERKDCDGGLRRLAMAIDQGAKYEAVRVVLENAKRHDKLDTDFVIPDDPAQFAEQYRGYGYSPQ